MSSIYEYLDLMNQKNKVDVTNIIEMHGDIIQFNQNNVIHMAYKTMVVVRAKNNHIWLNVLSNKE